MPTPNDCVRFIYGQGCYGCHNYHVCWPTVTTSTVFMPCTTEPCLHHWNMCGSTSAGEMWRCEKCGATKVQPPIFGESE